jgi:hypothetical protein
MTTNNAASVRARLTNRARDTRRPFQEVLQHYGLERFLYRLAQSSHGARGTLLEPEPVALTASFTAADNSQKQWTAFVKRSQLEGAPKALDELREPLRQFLLPVVGALIAGEMFDRRWPQAGPWDEIPAATPVPF